MLPAYTTTHRSVYTPVQTQQLIQAAILLSSTCKYFCKNTELNVSTITEVCYITDQDDHEMILTQSLSNRLRINSHLPVDQPVTLDFHPLFVMEKNLCR